MAALYERQAFERRDRVSEGEKLYITGAYYFTIGDVEKAIETYRLFKQTYPRDLTPPNNLAVHLNEIGNYDKAVEAAAEAMRRDPNSPFPYVNLTRAYAGLNRFEEAKSVAEKAIAAKLDFPPVHHFLYAFAYIHNDQKEMLRQIDWAKGAQPNLSISFFRHLAESDVARGRLAEARKVYERTLETAKLAERKEFGAHVEADWSFSDAILGNCVQAKARASKTIALDHSLETEQKTALVFSFCGDEKTSARLINDMKTRFPSDTLLRAVWIPCAQALNALNLHDFANAEDALKAAKPYDTAGLSLDYYNGFISPYIRGLAFLQARKGSEAAAEFSNILQHQGASPLSPLYPLAYLGLARAYSLQGDTAKSRTAYQDFFALWKDADPEIPILQQAKAEYVTLN